MKKSMKRACGSRNKRVHSPSQHMSGDPKEDATIRTSVQSAVAEAVLTVIVVVTDGDVIVDVDISKVVSVSIVITASQQETLSTSGVRYRPRSGKFTSYRRM
jgi:hypothetical protein